jgi:endogenous inhibitor of DNA gyrase (YacG/DUF329 family)
MSERPGPKIICPACKKKGDWFAGKYGPFCSHRCRLIDMGKWLGGEHAISEPLRADNFDEMTETKAKASNRDD